MREVSPAERCSEVHKDELGVLGVKSAPIRNRVLEQVGASRGEKHKVTKEERGTISTGQGCRERQVRAKSKLTGVRIRYSRSVKKHLEDL